MNDIYDYYYSAKQWANNLLFAPENELYFNSVFIDDRYEQYTYMIQHGSQPTVDCNDLVFVGTAHKSAIKSVLMASRNTF